jgi:hypothetical protein
MRFTSRLLVAAFAFAVPLPLLGAQGSGAAANISVIPRPQSVAAGRGTFTFTSRTVIWSDRADSAVARRFSRSLAPATRWICPCESGRRRAETESSFAAARVTRRSAPRGIARRAAGCRDDHVVGTGGRVLRDANAIAASSRRRLSLSPSGVKWTIPL